MHDIVLHLSWVGEIAGDFANDSYQHNWAQLSPDCYDEVQGAYMGWRLASELSYLLVSKH